MTTADRIAEVDEKITSITNEIAAIDAETINDQDLCDCIAQRRNELQNYLNLLNDEKTNLTDLQTLENTALTSAQQTTVDGINTLFNNQYQRQMNSIQYMNTSRREEFFTLYAAAETDFIREQFIKSYFRLS